MTIAIGTIVSIDSVSHAYGGRSALSDLTLELSRGTTALVGVNGAGKSTLLRVLAGALKPDRGSIRLQGDDPYGRGQRKAGLRRVAMMPQLATFPPNMTVVEVVGFIGWLRGMKGSTASARAAQVVEQVGLGERAGEQVKRLSGGMLRRVALAQALVSEPEVLLLDEPSTGLDPEQRRMMVALIKDLDTTVLFSSHVIEDVQEVAERVLVLESGRLLFDGGLPALEALGLGLAGGPAGRASGVEAGFLSVIAQDRSRGSE